MIIAIALGLAIVTAHGGVSDSLLARVERRLRAEESRLIAFRRDLHQHPEVSGAEERTAGQVAARLRELGLDVRTGVGGHGVVALIRGARPGPLVAFRADMDAVPSSAPDPVEFRSLTAGVRHICGHDLHTTVGVAIAEALAGLRAELAGTVMLVFQPAEERVTGAKAMLADGLFAQEKPVAIYAVHTAPLPVGQLGTRPGAMMASIDAIRVTITGTGDHSRLADSAVRVIRSASTTTRAAAIQGTAPEGGLVADAVVRSEGAGRLVLGSVSSASADARALARQTILAGLEKLRSPGVDVKVEYEDRMAAGVQNDAALVDRGNAAIRAALGEGSTVAVPVAPLVFSEDFGSLQDQVPGVLWFLGVSNAEKGWVGMPHTPNYVADEAAIVVAARAMTAVLLDRLQTVASRFVGTWRLVSIHSNDSADARNRGLRPTGYIYYDATGHMAVQIQPERKRASWRGRTPTADEALDAARGYTAYFGTWRVDEKAGTITHHREGALNLDVVDYVRRYTFEGNDRLTLAPVDRPGLSLLWERVK